MTQEEINTVLRRTLRSGADRYNSFFPTVNCEVYKSGHGSPKYILDFMKQVASKHYKQVSKLAAELKTTDLQSTVAAFYNFQYSYIQYDVDGYRQNVLSPACAWKNRLSGMDCKSFTVFSAALCKASNIKCYMRQIKQGEDRVSHVYLVVPLDQSTGSLDQGHYVIDATTSDNKEVYYTWKNDLNMNLPVVGMNAPVVAVAPARINETTVSEYHNCLNVIESYNQGMGVNDTSFDWAGLVSGLDVGTYLGANEYDSTLGSAAVTGAFTAGGAIAGSYIPVLGTAIGGAIGGVLGGIASGLLGEALVDFDFTCTNSWYDPLDLRADLKNLTEWYQAKADSLGRFLTNGQNVNAANVLTELLGVLSAIEMAIPIKVGEARSNCTISRLEDLKTAATDLKFAIENIISTDLSAAFNITYKGVKEFKVNDYKNFLQPMDLADTPAFLQDVIVLTYKPELLPETQPNARMAGLSNGNGLILIAVLISAIVGGTIYFKDKKK